MMSQGFEEIIGSDGCDDNDIMWWPIVIAIIRSHVNYTEMMTDGDWSVVMMTMSVLTSVSWHHVTNVTWHQLRPRDMCLRLSPVTKLSISSIQMSSLSPRLACLSVRSSGQQRAGWIELKSFEMINITSPHWTDPKNHHLQCAHWARVDKNWLRSTPNVFTSSGIIFLRGDEIQMTFEMFEYDVTPVVMMTTCAHGPVVTCPPPPSCHIVSPGHICILWNVTPATGHMRPVTNVTTIISRKRRDGPSATSDCRDCPGDSDKSQGTSRTKEDGYCLGWAWIVTETEITVTMRHNGRDIEERRDCDWHSAVSPGLPRINELTLSCSDNISLAPGGRRSLEQIQKYKRLT